MPVRKQARRVFYMMRKDNRHRPGGHRMGNLSAPQAPQSHDQSRPRGETDRLDSLIDKATGLVTSRYTSSRQNLRVIPMGGVEEVGENMTALEFGDDI